MDLLPQVGTENLNQRDFQGWDLSMHENSRQIQLYLEADVNVCSVDSRRPPQRKTTVRNLVQTRTLRVCQLLELHLLLEAAASFPEQTLPRGKVRSLEQCVLQDALHSSKGL